MIRRGMISFGIAGSATAALVQVGMVRGDWFPLAPSSHGGALLWGLLASLVAFVLGIVGTVTHLAGTHRE